VALPNLALPNFRTWRYQIKTKNISIFWSIRLPRYIRLATIM
jgi:hypothetical protein